MNQSVISPEINYQLKFTQGLSIPSYPHDRIVPAQRNFSTCSIWKKEIKKIFFAERNFLKKPSYDVDVKKTSLYGEVK